MRVDTSEYFGSHGKRPRGYGYWHFAFIKTDPSTGPRGQTKIVAYTGTYTDAKKRALKEARKYKINTVLYVLP